MGEGGLVSWLLNPWDYGGSYAIFAGVTAVVAWVASRTAARTWQAAVGAAGAVSVAYLVGAILDTGGGPLVILGFLFLFLPGLAIAWLTVWLARRVSR